MRGRASSQADPYIYDRSSSVVGYPTAQGRTPTVPRLVAGERTAIVLMAGQSKLVNTSLGLYTPTSTKVENFNFDDGGLWLAVEPLLGCFGSDGNFMTRAADKLIVSLGTFDRVVLVPVAVGSTPVEDWVAGTALNQRILVACRRLRNLGMPVTLGVWDQGENNLTVPGPTELDYRTKLLSVFSAPRGEGFNFPWFVNKVSKAPGVLPDDGRGDGIRAAQTSICNGTDIFPGADGDSLGASYRQISGVHWNAVGNDADATLMAAAIDAVFGTRSGGTSSSSAVEQRRKRKTGFEPVKKLSSAPIAVERRKPPLPPFRSPPQLAPAYSSPLDLVDRDLIPQDLLGLQGEIYTAQAAFALQRLQFEQDEQDMRDIAAFLATID